MKIWQNLINSLFCSMFSGVAELWSVDRCPGVAFLFIKHEYTLTQSRWRPHKILTPLKVLSGYIPPECRYHQSLPVSDYYSLALIMSLIPMQCNNNISTTTVCPGWMFLPVYACVNSFVTEIYIAPVHSYCCLVLCG